ncbi:hypothetical protein QVD17_19669 [Tagetes erecta]|uniref:Acyl-[acyl-carrier-protein] hydrolase n=1 Tax=Tagetes erecta TaxID=13708 RepID=A0AAD8KK06_TARER|nr:hypothetical protein QVD17_19669 [Tagetes erecta]
MSICGCNNDGIPFQEENDEEGIGHVQKYSTTSTEDVKMAIGGGWCDGSEEGPIKNKIFSSNPFEKIANDLQSAHGLQSAQDVVITATSGCVAGSHVFLGQVKTNEQAPTKLPDWRTLLAAITTIFLAAEKQWMMLVDLGPIGFGRIVEDGLVFRDNFPIRSFEIVADRTASVETLMNYLQETSLNHVKNSRLLPLGFGSTLETCKKNLFWMLTKMQVLVDRYPTW